MDGRRSVNLPVFPHQHGEFPLPGSALDQHIADHCENSRLDRRAKAKAEAEAEAKAKAEAEAASQSAAVHDAIARALPADLGLANLAVNGQVFSRE